MAVPAMRINNIIVAIVAMLLLVERRYCIVPMEQYAHDDWNSPCKFIDSINITGMPLDNVFYTPDMIGDFDYEILNETLRQTTPLHRRMCVCRHRPCMRLFCERGHEYDPATRDCRPEDRLRDVRIEVTSVDNGSLRTVNLYDHFGVTVGRPCAQMSMLDPTEFADDKWQMYENGTLKTLAGDAYTQHSYALSPRINDTSLAIELDMYFCFKDYKDNDQVRFDNLATGMLLSVPFLIATFLVYAILPDLRNVHGKSLMCYLAGLANGYTLLAYLQIYPSLNSAWCKPLGYAVYFWFMASFLWLNVISFDLWWNFRGIKGINKMNENRKFLVYSAYAWGLSLASVLCIALLDNSTWVPAHIRPGFALYRCWFQQNRWIEFGYLYLPTMVIFVANTSFFTMTALKIRRVQMEMVRVTSKEDSRRHKSQFEQEKDKYGLFLRLFIVMGVTWTMEVLSWLIDPLGWVFYLSDAMNCVQGVVIFLLFVMKPKVKKLLLKRWKLFRGTGPEQRGISYSGTHTTQVTNSSTVRTPSVENTLLMRTNSNTNAGQITGTATSIGRL